LSLSRKYVVVYGFPPMRPSIPKWILGREPTQEKVQMAKDKTGEPRRPDSSDGSSAVKSFLVERNLVDLSPNGLLAIHEALAESCRRLTMSGRAIEYQRSVFAVERGWCLSVFTASDREAVGLANDVAQVPFVRIEDGLDLENLDL
jgi:hypothetical protein